MCLCELCCDCLFNVFILIFIRHIEVPAIFEDPNSLKQVNVSFCILFLELLWVCKILREIYICLLVEGRGPLRLCLGVWREGEGYGEGE